MLQDRADVCGVCATQCPKRRGTEHILRPVLSPGLVVWRAGLSSGAHRPGFEFKLRSS